MKKVGWEGNSRNFTERSRRTNHGGHDSVYAFTFSLNAAICGVDFDINYMGHSAVFRPAHSIRSLLLLPQQGLGT